MAHSKNSKASLAGVIIALGIIYGDIGTSPLYVFNAIIGQSVISKELVYGAVSCVFWTITLLTTIKYVMITLEADNKGEGGIFSLFALVRRYKWWVVFPAMIGGATLMADGIITPPITVSSAIEGLGLDHQVTKFIVVAILAGLFFIQKFGSKSIGFLFGPIMLIWFCTLGVVGLYWVLKDLSIIQALNPYYAFKLLSAGNGGIFILSGVFLSTTGAEALYSDLGHCGKANIRRSWIFVKSCLILVYLGQASMLMKYEGQVVDFRIFFKLFGESHGIQIFAVSIATVAAVIASQALISGTFTLISEGIRLNLWPKMTIKYPTESKGQLYISGINWMLLLGCLFVVYYFKDSTAMESAYGLSITITMLMTSILLSVYIWTKRKPFWTVVAYLIIYLTIEFAFLYANLTKFAHGGYIAAIIAGALFIVMYVWYKSKIIKSKFVDTVPISNYLDAINRLSLDETIPKYSDHLIYMTSEEQRDIIEQKVMYSIFNKRPKRADSYWFIHVNTMDHPYTREYKVTTLVPKEVFRVDINLGFRVEQRVQAMFRKILNDMKSKGEIAIEEKYQSVINKKDVLGDYQFIVIEKFLSIDNLLKISDKVILQLYFFIKNFSLSESRFFGIDNSYVVTEKLPMIVTERDEPVLKRLQ